MIPRSTFEELKGKKLRLYIKDLPDPHCIQLGKIEAVTEHLIIFNDEEHKNLIYIPLENVVLIKTA